MLLEFVEAGIFRPELGEIVVAAECVEIGEHAVAFEVTRVVNTQVCWVGVHAAHLLPYIFGRVAQIYAVAETLAHLCIAVGAWQTQASLVVGEHDFWFHEHFTVGVVETVHQFAGLLNHWALVLTGRHDVGLEEGDVGSLAHRVAEEAHRNAFALSGCFGSLLVLLAETTHFDFRLNGRVALKARHAYQVHQVGGEFAQFRDLALNEKRALFWVKSGGEVVERHFYNVLTDFLRVVGIVGECLNIGHKHKHAVVVALILQLYAATERTHIMADMEFACWTVASKNYFSHFKVYYFVIIFVLSYKDTQKRNLSQITPLFPHCLNIEKDL